MIPCFSCKSSDTRIRSYLHTTYLQHGTYLLTYYTTLQVCVDVRIAKPVKSQLFWILGASL